MGAFDPLTGFMGALTYESVVEGMRLEDGRPWPMPIVFPYDGSESLKLGTTLRLETSQGSHVATLEVEEVFKPDLAREFEKVLGCSGPQDYKCHPWSSHLLSTYDVNKLVYVGGKVTAGPVSLRPLAFQGLHLQPEETKTIEGPLIGMQTRNPLHCCHLELLKRAMRSVGGAKVLLQPVVGPTQPGDVPPDVRIKCYEAAIKTLSPEAQARVTLCLLPLAMRMAGPREALWHALIRKNYGCTHFVVGRDHAGPSTKRGDGSGWYGGLEAQDLVASFQEEIGIQIIRVGHLHYVPSASAYLANGEFGEGEPTKRISGTQLRTMLKEGKEVPSWFSPPEVVDILQAYYGRGGLCVYFTGLSGAGKSTLAEGLAERLKEVLPSSKAITVLDGDIVRTHLSKGLGFSAEDRSTNVRRIGYVASEIVKHGGIVLVANIAPFTADRLANRASVEAVGRYVQVHVSTSLEVCEKRDVKGLYAKVRAGEIKLFTGVSSPYEDPEEGVDMGPSDFTLDTDASLDASLTSLMKHLGY